MSAPIKPANFYSLQSLQDNHAEAVYTISGALNDFLDRDGLWESINDVAGTSLGLYEEDVLEPGQIEEVVAVIDNYIAEIRAERSLSNGELTRVRKTISSDLAQYHESGEEVEDVLAGLINVLRKSADAGKSVLLSL